MAPQSLAVAMEPPSTCAMLPGNRKRVREDAEDEPVTRRPRPRRSRSAVVGSEVEVATQSNAASQDENEDWEKKTEDTMDGSPTEVTDPRALVQPRVKEALASRLPDLEEAAASPGASTASSATQEQGTKRATDIHRPVASRRARRPPLGDRRGRVGPSRALFRLSGLGIVRCRQLLESTVDGEETEDDSDPAPTAKPRTEPVVIPMLPIDLANCDCFEDDGEVADGSEEEWQVHSPAPYPGFDPAAASPQDKDNTDADEDAASATDS